MTTERHIIEDRIRWAEQHDWFKYVQAIDSGNQLVTVRGDIDADEEISFNVAEDGEWLDLYHWAGY